MHATPSPLVRLSVALLSTALVCQPSIAAAQSDRWSDFRAVSSRTGTINASLSITEPRLAWRYARATPGVTIDPLGPTIAEVDLALDGSRELIAVTDRSIAAWDAVSGRQRWPSGLGAYSPLQYIVGVADLNGDGRRDIVAVGRDNVVAVFDDAGELRWALPSNRVAGSFVGLRASST